MLICVALFLIGVCLGILWCEDIARFEIKLEVLPVVALCGAGLALAWGSSWLSLLLGGLVWFIPSLIVQRLRPSGLGMGDIWLFGTAGLVFGIEYTIFGGLLFGAFAVVSAWIYARARGKAFGRSMFPAAVPMVIAIVVVLQWRVLSTLNTEFTDNPLAYAVLLVLPAGLLLGLMFYRAARSLNVEAKS